MPSSSQGTANLGLPLASFDEAAERFARKLRNDQRTLAIYSRSLERIDRTRVRELQEKYRSRIEAAWDTPYYKFLDIPQQLWAKSRLITQLGLDTVAPLRILDLGAGGGHFLFCAANCGHDTTAIDLELDFYDDLFNLYGLRFLHHAIHPEECLPHPGPFDLVTALGVTFNEYDRSTFWLFGDWCSFLIRVAKILTEDGEIILQANKQEREQIRHGDRVLEYFERLGGNVDRQTRFVRVGANTLRAALQTEGFESQTRVP